MLTSFTYRAGKASQITDIKSGPSRRRRTSLAQNCETILGNFERVRGIEPLALAWKAKVLPLYDTRLQSYFIKKNLFYHLVIYYQFCLYWILVSNNFFVKHHRILMIGWEYYPHYSGGLGVACQGIVENLVDSGEEVTLLLPKSLSPSEPDQTYFTTKKGHRYKVCYIQSILRPYLGCDGITYQGDLTTDVHAFAKIATQVAKGLDFDIIHVHDWLTVPAGIAIKEASHKPLVLHVHSTEYDRTAGGHPNEFVAKIEQRGYTNANLIITVSKYTKNLLVERYQVPADKIVVIHNGVDYAPNENKLSINFLQNHPVIVFVGRLTIQKGPDYFLSVARKVIDQRPEAVFVFVGDGDMYHHLLLTSAYLNLSGSVLFAGFLRGHAKDLLYERADVFLMPSVSEPFGIVALEAAATGTPIIISKTSGVSEVLPSAIKIDFWDTNLMANTILKLLDQPQKQKRLGKKLMSEVGAVTWGKTAIKIKETYYHLLAPEFV